MLKQSFSVTLLIAAIDKVARNRSGFLADAARVALAAKRDLAAA